MLPILIHRRLKKATAPEQHGGTPADSLTTMILRQWETLKTEVQASWMPMARLQSKMRYLQLAFNEDWAQARHILHQIEPHERILIEAGTPYIKREGIAGIRAIRAHWPGPIVADLKTTDGGAEEVAMVHTAGATAVTVLGSSPTETLDRFIAACERLNMDAMIDMLGVPDPLRVLMRLRKPPHVVVLHRGRDEEGTRGKVIGYRHISRVRSKFDVLISAAGGVNLHEARSAIFNGADIVVVNIVSPGKPWEGIRADSDVGAMTREFLATIE